MMGACLFEPSRRGIAVGRMASLPLAYARPSTSGTSAERDVEARHEAGHDEQEKFAMSESSR